MQEQLEALNHQALNELGGISEMKTLEEWRVKYLGKKSRMTEILRGLATLSLEEKKTLGARANGIKAALEQAFNEKKIALSDVQLTQTAAQSAVDITLPGRPEPRGHLHPLMQAVDEIGEIFNSMGFEVVEGPEVEWDYYNFEALNIPPEHPARDNMSSLWAQTFQPGRKALLRTHTTSVSARILETRQPPIRTVNLGKVYRYEASDARHSMMFHQVDGLAVDEGITMGDLKGTLYEFARRFFGADRQVRFRCDYFPFVEPGVEMAIDCAICRGTGCRLCGNSGWIEILGAGMTHPRVLQYGNIDPDKYTSFAFGIGIDRLPMLKYGIDDIRLLYGNDLRFLKQF